MAPKDCFFGHGLQAVVFERHIAGRADGCDAGFVQTAQQRIQRGHLAIQRDDPGAGLAEAQAQRPTEAAGSPGDDDDLVEEVPHVQRQLRRTVSAGRFIILRSA